ncbi:uncharacterized protein [Drosophila bipectinata]|uniref:uncharacterized protein n=1 Tax=Drosophila bipectinata TaxID=42026 RepID=UPI001C89E549|nr:uncharacterized protein LOC108133662 [Drosophila bipectinata]
MDRALLFDLHQPEIIIPEPNTSAVEVAKHCLPPGTIVRISLLDSPPESNEEITDYEVIKYDYCRQLLRLKTAKLVANDEEAPQPQLVEAEAVVVVEEEAKQELEAMEELEAKQEPEPKQDQESQQELEAKEEVESQQELEAKEELEPKQELEAEPELLEVSEDPHAKGDTLSNQGEADQDALDAKQDLLGPVAAAPPVALPEDGGGGEEACKDEVPQVILVDLRYCCKLDIIRLPEPETPKDKEEMLDIQEPDKLKEDGVDQEVELQKIRPSEDTLPHIEHEDIVLSNEEDKEDLDIEQDIRLLWLDPHKDDDEDEEETNKEDQEEMVDQLEVPELQLESEASEWGDSNSCDFDDDPSFEPSPLVLELRRLLRRQLPYVGRIRCEPNAIIVEDRVIIQRPYLAINVKVLPEPEATSDSFTSHINDIGAYTTGQLLAEIRCLVHQFHEEFIVVLLWRRLRFNEASLETPRFDPSFFEDNSAEEEEDHPSSNDAVDNDELLQTDPEPEPETEPEDMPLSAKEPCDLPAKQPRKKKCYVNFIQNYEYVTKKVDTATPEGFLNRLRQIQANKMKLRQLELAKARLEESRRLADISLVVLNTSPSKSGPRPRRLGHKRPNPPRDSPKNRDSVSV